MMFVADENGNYDKEELFDDAMNVFKSMKPYKFEQGFLKGTIGEGSILVELPDNALMNFILGERYPYNGSGFFGVEINIYRIII